MFDIGAAIAALPVEGGLVRVPPGFHEVGRVDAAVPVEIAGAGKGRTVLVRRDDGPDPLLVLTAPGSIVRDLTVDGAYPTKPVAAARAEVSLVGVGSEAIRFEVRNFHHIGIELGADRCAVRDSDLIGVGVGADGSTFGAWFNVATLVGAEVTGCVFRDMRLNAFYPGGSGVRVTKNLFLHNHRQTVPVGGGQIVFDWTCRDVLVWGNTIVGNRSLGPGYVDEGIECDAVSGLIAGNTIVGCAANGILLRELGAPVVGVTAVGNTILGCGQLGVRVDPGNGGANVVWPNLCQGNGDAMGMTPALGTKIDTNWGGTERDVLSNIRQRLGEVEAILARHGMARP